MSIDEVGTFKASDNDRPVLAECPLWVESGR